MMSENFTCLIKTYNFKDGHYCIMLIFKGISNVGMRFAYLKTNVEAFCFLFTNSLYDIQLKDRSRNKTKDLST